MMMSAIQPTNSFERVHARIEALTPFSLRLALASRTTKRGSRRTFGVSMPSGPRHFWELGSIDPWDKNLSLLTNTRCPWKVGVVTRIFGWCSTQ